MNWELIQRIVRGSTDVLYARARALYDDLLVRRYIIKDIVLCRAGCNQDASDLEPRLWVEQIAGFCDDRLQ